ncbi:MAG: polyprenyl synthetase family protein [Candidatus Melainabacteria bacterium]|nr:polyprenyl synthetase family protein [Candidatus Melainabacteria bacterium]
MKQTLEKITKEKTIKWPDFFNVINNELFILEENLTKKLPAKSLLLQEIVSYIFKAGGKRLRPALCFLIAKSTGEITNKHIILSELTELIHTASLIHDDIIDSANLRRGRETINSLWNDKISVITGDFLFAQASIRLGELENTEIVKIYAKVLSDLCDGEIEQYSSKFNPDISWEHYLNKSTTKTASLFSAACKSSAILNNQEKKIINQAEQFGNNLGIAFQIIDDVLDFTSNSKEIGKEVGTDLKQGIITAPALFAVNSTDIRANQIKTLIENRFNNGSEEDFDKAIRLVHELGGCEKAKQLAYDYIDKAKENLDFVKDGDLKTYLSKAGDFILERIS